MLVTANKEYCFMAIYDGHGGFEAAKYAHTTPWPTIKAEEGFYSPDSQTVCKAIMNGFVTTHESMWKVRGLLLLMITHVHVYMHIVK